jgi:flagellar export protein FliJ
MTRFRFSLQAVHNLRERARAEAEAEMARARGEAAQARAKLEEAGAAHARAMEDYRQMIFEGKFSSLETMIQAGYLKVLAERIAEAQKNLAGCEGECEQARQKLIAATVEAEATAKLRHRQFEKYQRECDREEQQQMDEIAALQAARSRMQ